MSNQMALLIIDLQNDFCPGGALPVAHGDQVVEPLNRAIHHFITTGMPVFASRDWHPPDSRHFQEHGGQWPVHCVRDTPGAAFHPDFNLPAQTVVLSKGLDSHADGYSAFEGQTEDGALLVTLLTQAGIDHLCIGGLATDYCVKATVMDALSRGLSVTVLADGIAGVNIHPGDGQRALEEMSKAGARIRDVDTVLSNTINQQTT
ncbi:bifunctional nicotinamidase/pyrazinamidase [Desulfobulbus alkaliphilus]|uniref:bifunctional nicotinamidase/pyrazinamidase n=1 Tax=Desulfobulbus alkaliphilus TaxID=869814 RepID=UPI001962E288|nr:bifunctional nicotinamidase/pyrazinamidase [Desulfobulbus alkaliphilus]MBM9538761.1 bifunctional nicotinamidase/pyrazinamidase [Desulfobulbus alkaliphilus]